VLDGYFDADEMAESVWRRVIDIDLTGVFLGCKRALAEMLPRRRGRIVNMASVAGLNGTGGGVAYVAAKHGVVGLTRQMAVAYASRGITVNAVCPGPIATGLRAHSQQILGPDIPDMSGRGVAVNDEQIRAIVPAGRRGTVEDIASAVCYLASDEAGYVTGHTMVVDGGRDDLDGLGARRRRQDSLWSPPGVYPHPVVPPSWRAPHRWYFSLASRS
jgi:NAD(P)-dependent dehydrogenase (short-subunit alcohol dehydrogenase family)